jgi:TRAP-type C4-dicarboxylate transport system substrate-binding protein
MANLKWVQVAPYVTIVDVGALPAVALTVNLDTWNKLPKEVRDIMQEAANVFMEKGMKEVAEEVLVTREKIEELGGKISTLDPKERKRWVNALPEIPLKMAKEGDAKGLPGTEVLNRYIELQKAAGYTFAKDWKVE